MPSIGHGAASNATLRLNQIVPQAERLVSSLGGFALYVLSSFYRQRLFTAAASDAVDDVQYAFAACKVSRHFVFVGEIHQGNTKEDK